MVRFHIDSREVRELEKKFGKFLYRSWPYIVRYTLNDIAFETRRQAQRVIRETFNLRNKYTETNVIVTKVPTGMNDPRKMFSQVGALKKLEGRGNTKAKPSNYMRDQEFGATQTKNGKHGVPIPTRFSTGDESIPSKKKPPEKLPTRRNFLHSIKMAKGHTGGDRHSRNAKRIAQAKKNKQRVVFLELAKSKGLFELRRTDSRRKIRGRIRKVTKLRMLWDLSEQSITIKPTSWLHRSRMKAAPHIGPIYGRQLKKQLRFRKLIQ